MNLLKQLLLSGLIFFCLSTNLDAQKKWEYGIGLGLNASNFILQSDVSEDTDLFERGISPTTKIRAEFNHDSKFRTTLDAGFTFIIAKSKVEAGEEQTTTSGVNLEFPLLFHYKVFKDMSLSAGPSYSYLVGMSAEQGDQSSNITDFLNNRHLISSLVGINYDINNWVELGLNYSRNINSFLQTDVTDISGNPAGELTIKHHYFQFAIIATH